LRTFGNDILSSSLYKFPTHAQRDADREELQIVTRPSMQCGRAPVKLSLATTQPLQAGLSLATQGWLGWVHVSLASVPARQLLRAIADDDCRTSGQRCYAQSARGQRQVMDGSKLRYGCQLLLYIRAKSQVDDSTRVNLSCFLNDRNN